MKQDDIIKENKVVPMSVFLGFWLFSFGPSRQFFTDPFPFLNLNWTDGLFAELTEKKE